MATYTDNYQLTKPLYSETADVAAINNNMDKIDDIMHASQVSLAPAYDQNETYNTGDVVMYEFLMYECLEDNVTGVWDATKWQRTTAGEHGGGSSASEVSYDNTDSGMTATNVQDAIDELKGEIEDIPSVEANPQGAATEELTKIGIGGTIYEIDSEEITGEASGAIASFADGSANPLKSLVVDINPVQAGSGTPAPDNVRPISGRSSVEVTRTGKNLLDGLSFAENIRDYGYNATLNTTDKYVRFSRSVKDAETGSFNRPLFELNFKPNTAYTVIFSYKNNATNGSLVFEYTDGTVQQFELVSSSNQKRTYVNSSNGSKTVKRINLSWYSDGQTDLYYEESGLFEGVLTAQDFEPYVATTKTISLGQTVYGGKLNVTTGELTVDRAMVDLGALNWIYSTADTRFFTTDITDIKKVMDTSIVMNGLCSHYDIVAYRYVNKTSVLDSVMGLYSTSTTNYLAIKDTRYTDTTTFTQAVNGVQLVYELATPTTVTLTPTEVDSLLGNNNIWADSGDSDVVYVRDIDKAFNILWDAVMNSNSGTRSLNLMKGAISETKEDIEEPIKEEEETKEGNDENKR